MILFLCWAVQICAQSDPVLLKIGDTPITRSEFEAAYHNYHSSPIYGKKSAKDYLSMYINDKLKVAEAKSLQLDTISTIRSIMSSYDRKQTIHFLLNQRINGILEAGGQREKVKNAQPVKILGIQIFRYIPQNCSKKEQEAIEQSVKALYAQLIADPQIDFAQYVERYSDDKNSFEIAEMETSPEFEQIVFSMQKGELSKPFITPQGIHIVQVLDRKTDSFYDTTDETAFVYKMKRLESARHTSFWNKMKDEHQYTPNQQNINELFKKGHTDGVLFSLNGENYTGADFREFAEGNPKGIQRQFDDYVAKQLFEYEVKLLDQQKEENSLLREEYRDEILLREINRQKIGSKVYDQAGLMAYFSVHKKKYRWKQPRFRGAVIHCRDWKIISEAKKLVKKQPAEKWESLINERFNNGPVVQVKVEQGLFAEGDNAFVDELIFKKGSAAPLPSYPFAGTIGKKSKTPERYEEVLDPLRKDYAEFLESLWMAHLHKTYRVEINEEVLKTVNNH